MFLACISPPSCCCCCGGGGGGYAGGGGGGNGDFIPDSNGGGGGGGSLNTTTDAINMGAVIAADTDGLVEICYNTVAAPPPPPMGTAIAVPALNTWGLILLALSLMGFAARSSVRMSRR